MKNTIMNGVNIISYAYMYIDVPRLLTNDLKVFLFQTIDAEYVNEPVWVEHMCMSKLL